MEKLKIIKLQEGVFKHVLNNVDEQSFYNTESCILSIDLGTIALRSANVTRNFTLPNITVYPSADSAAMEINTIDEFVIALKNLGYPLIKSDPALQWDSIIPSTTATTDVYTYKLGTTAVLTKTITYTDSTKSTIQKIEKV
jgi:hypothetical protein